MLEDADLANLASIPVPLPPVLPHRVFTEDQWTTLISICEVFLPSINSSELDKKSYDAAKHAVQTVLPEGAADDLAETYLSETVAGDPNFKESVRQRLVTYVPAAQLKGLGILLSALNSKLGSLAMTGSTTLIHSQPLAVRAQIVLQWADSYIAPLRALYFTGESLTKVTWIAMSSTLYQVIDFPHVPKNIKRHLSYDFKFLDFEGTPASETANIDADIVIIGSGCGAGVVAEHLSSALKDLTKKPKILLLEKGYFHPSSHFPMDVSSAGIHLFESGGAILSDDSSIGVAAGSNFGGGGTVNWSASLQPQDFVREEWATKYKLPFLQSQHFQACLDEVCDKMGVCKMTDEAAKAKIEHSRGNEILIEGARRLGMTVEVVPQNTAGQRHYCGRCNMGCASVTKQGPANFWLPRAAKHGVEFIQGCFVEKILWDENASSASSRKAIGLKAVWTSKSRTEVRALQINASRIIVSSGSLSSPLVLHRSGLTPEVNKNFGSNLHLHPALPILATFRERMDPWDGAILTSAVTSYENLDGRGHGCKIEVCLGTPSTLPALMPHRPQLSIDAFAKSDNDTKTEAAVKTALDYKLRLANFGHSFGIIAIQRDHADDTNAAKSYVYANKEEPGKIRINYSPSSKDREGVLQGAIAGARIAYTMGATSIDIFSAAIPVFTRPSHSTDNTSSSESEGNEGDDKAFDQWIADIKIKGAMALLDTRYCRLGSAHQMSSCRMSSSPREGAVDPKGKVWGTSNVYIADASILPSASGVNPMISTMGISLHVAKGISEEVIKQARN